MAAKQRKTPGMRERSPQVWELIVESGRDPVSGKRRQVSRIFRGGYAAAKKARAELLVDTAKGRHTGTRATVNDLFEDWVIELRGKGRSPNTVHGYENVYRRNIAPTLGSVPVVKVTTKMLTDLYGAHQKRGLAPRSVYQVHACLSSMMTQACRWGWRDSTRRNGPSRRPSPTTNPWCPHLMRSRSCCAPRRSRDDPRWPAPFLSRPPPVYAEPSSVRSDEIATLDTDRRRLRVSTSISVLPRQPVQEIPTKNRRIRSISVDALTLSMLQSQVELLEKRAELAGCELVEDPYLFTDSADGSRPWKPDTITQYFRRLRERVGLEHLDFHSLRKFMETYGQDLGFSAAQVAMRAGHDPSVAARHYTGSVEETDRALADAVAALLAPAVLTE